jgi:hypothetical protein
MLSYGELSLSHNHMNWNIIHFIQDDDVCNIDIVYAYNKESCYNSIPYGLPKILTHS